jgi:hypothetical protein
MKHFRILLIVLFLNSIAVNPGVSLDTSWLFRSVRAETLRPLLNSERIKLKYGSYGIDVLRNREQLRFSNLYSVKNGKKTTRTLAVVAYPDVIDPLLLKEHQQVIAGQSIGAVFKQNGWTIEKRHAFFGEIEASSKFAQVYSLMGDIVPAKFAIHIYTFFVSKNGNRFLYARISEVHHPGYLDSSGMKGIYGKEYEMQQNKNEDIQAKLEVVMREMEGI